VRASCVAWPIALLGGFVATFATGGVMLYLRSEAQVRTVPERLLEALLLFIPPDVFEAGLQRFGFDAKRYGLFGATAGMLAVLVVVGAVALRWRWSTAALAALGIGLWLFVMLVVMPLTNAGPFAIDVIGGTRTAILGNLSAALVYSGVLALAGLAIDRWPDVNAPPRRTSRRALVTLLGASVGSLITTYIVVLTGPRQTLTSVRVLDPQEPVPSGGIDRPQPHPEVVNTPPPVAAQSTDAAPAAAPTAVVRDSQLPQPAPSRSLRRDQDGALMPSGRSKGELTPLITPTEDFYVVTKNAAGDPIVRPEDWRLRIDGDVPRPLETDYLSLRNMPWVEVTKTLECISNFVAKCELVPFGCDLISTARWRGVRLRDLLALAGGTRSGAQYVATISADEFTTALPIEIAMDPETLLVYEMNGEVLPREHGYPARVLVPGRYGMKNAKWVVALRAVSRDFVDWYGQRNWNREGIVKTMTRIDTPAPDALLPAGEHRLAGIAYAGDRGISRVEYSTDAGMTWSDARFIEPPVGKDAWIRWEGTFTLAAEQPLTLMSRATDGLGHVQPEWFTLPQPDGGTGWHAISVHGSA
jgi:DMSO/TMAO reductase YedYZ molybdopterin-dependent catalytic subunit